MKKEKFLPICSIAALLTLGNPIASYAETKLTMIRESGGSFALESGDAAGAKSST